jgi:steroid delta-isomerase-like uncharacterized protein
MNPVAETVAREVETGLPPAPAFMALARFTYDPGALFGPAQGAGPVVFRLLRGRLSFQADKPVFLRRGGPTQPREVMGQEWFEVAAGDQLLVPGDVPHSAKSPGPEQALNMGLALFREAPAQEFPPGIGFQPLVFGPASSFPPEPAEASLRRMTLAAEPMRRAVDGPELVFVEAGAVTVTVEAGAVAVTPAPGAPALEPVAPGAPRALTAGHGLSAQAGAALTLAGEGAVLVVASVRDARAASREAKEVARRYFYEVWNDGGVDLVDRLFAPEFVNRHPLDGQSANRAGIRQLVEASRRAFPDCSVSVDLQVSEAGRVATRYTFRGTHRGRFLGLEPTGRPVAVPGIAIFRIGDRGIEEAWGYWELATLLAQIGRQPWPAGV